MIRALVVTGRAFGLWWREFFLLLFFNVAWLALQIPIITGPPATAAMYVIARRVAGGELIDPRQGWSALREMFVPSWKWGLVNLVIVIPLVGNSYLYEGATGTLWTILRLAWGAIALVWFTVNLFYWPFWLAQSDHRALTTYRNSLVMLIKAPAFAFTLAIISALLIAGSILFAIPLGATLMTWLSLMGVVAVDEEVKRGQTTKDE